VTSKPKPDPEDFDFLPGVLAEIASVAGLDNAIYVARAKGGTRVRIPAKCDAEHWLSKACGLAAALVICEHFAANGAGIMLDIPLGPASSDATRARAIRERLSRNETANEIARAVGVDRRTVFNHKAKLKSGEKDNGQGSLF